MPGLLSKLCNESLETMLSKATDSSERFWNLHKPHGRRSRSSLISRHMPYHIIGSAPDNNAVVRQHGKLPTPRFASSLFPARMACFYRARK